MDAAEEMVMDEQDKTVGAGAARPQAPSNPVRQQPVRQSFNLTHGHDYVVQGHNHGGAGGSLLDGFASISGVHVTSELPGGFRFSFSGPTGSYAVDTTGWSVTLSDQGPTPPVRFQGAGAGNLPGYVEASSLVSLYPGPGTNPIPTGVFYDAVKAFKVAYNIGINLGDTSGPNGDGPSTTQGYLQHNGNYDQATVDAVNATLGSGAPAAWAAAVPQQNNNPPQNNTVVASTGWPTWLKVVLWIIAIGGAVGLGLYLYKTFGSSSPSRAGESKRKKTGKRTSKKR